MDDLVKGLRGELINCDCAAASDYECCCADGNWPERYCKQAADEIERLRKERDDLQEKCNVFQEKMITMRERLYEAEAAELQWLTYRHVVNRVEDLEKQRAILRKELEAMTADRDAWKAGALADELWIGDLS